MSNVDGETGRSRTSKAFPRTVIVWGATGQGKVVRPILERAGARVGAFCDRDPTVTSPLPGIPILHSERELRSWLSERGDEFIGYVIAIGGTRGRERLVLDEYLSHLGLTAMTLIHHRGWVDTSAILGVGCQIAAMAAVAVESRLGRQCIVNTGATIDHECDVADGVHVMPGATVAGCVTIGCGATIGSNATVLPRIRIGEDAIVGAGAVVTRHVADGAVVVGVPATARGLAAHRTEGLTMRPWE